MDLLPFESKWEAQQIDDIIARALAAADFKKGTWTPMIYGVKTTMTPYTPDVSLNTWTRIGNVVFVQGYFPQLYLTRTPDSLNITDNDPLFLSGLPFSGYAGFLDVMLKGTGSMDLTTGLGNQGGFASQNTKILIQTINNPLTNGFVTGGNIGINPVSRPYNAPPGGAVYANRFTIRGFYYTDEEA